MKTYIPSGQALSPMATPSVEIIDGVKWEIFDGYTVGYYANPLLCNGISIPITSASGTTNPTLGVFSMETSATSGVSWTPVDVSPTDSDAVALAFVSSLAIPAHCQWSISRNRV